MEKLNAEVFLTVAQTGSFRRAADRLGYTQAGISYIVASMEESLDVPLFIRDRNGVRLSPEGATLYPQMKELQIWERKFKQTIKELNGLERGKVRVQIFDSISVHWLPGILRRFRDDFPKVKVELITEEDSARAEQMVLNGEVDCGFFLTKVNAKLDVFPLLEENLMATLPVNHPLAKEEKFPMSQLGKWPYIGMKYDSKTGIRDIFKKRRIKPNLAYQMDNDYAAMAMISEGLGFSIFPELLLQDAPYELKCIEFDEPQKRVISIGTSNMETASKACKKFMEYTRIWVQNMEKNKGHDEV